MRASSFTSDHFNTTLVPKTSIARKIKREGAGPWEHNGTKVSRLRRNWNYAGSYKAIEASVPNQVSLMRHITCTLLYDCLTHKNGGPTMPASRFPGPSKVYTTIIKVNLNTSPLCQIRSTHPKIHFHDAGSRFLTRETQSIVSHKPWLLNLKEIVDSGDY